MVFLKSVEDVQILWNAIRSLLCISLSPTVNISNKKTSKDFRITFVMQPNSPIRDLEQTVMMMMIMIMMKMTIMMMMMTMTIIMMMMMAVCTMDSYKHTSKIPLIH